MAVKGVFASDQQIVGNRVGDYAGSLLRIWPTGSAPLLALSSGMQTKPAQDTIVHWFEEVKLTGRKAVTSVNGDGDSTAFTVADASDFVAGTILLVEETSEYLLVSSVAANVLTVTRGIGATTQTTITTSHNLQRVGNAHEEGSSKPTAVTNLGDVRFNVTQIFRNSWSVTGTAKAIKYHTGSQVGKSVMDCAFIHAEDIERSLMWGRKHIGNLNSQPLRLMDGIITQATNHGATVAAQSSATSYGNLLNHWRQVFESNIKGKPNERIVFTGNTVVQAINVMARKDGVENMEPGETEFGLAVTKVYCPWGTIKLMTHPLMNENPVWTKALYTLHPGALRTRWLRKTQIEGYDKNGQRISGVDADEGIYTSELSMELMAAQTAGIYTAISGGVATGSGDSSL